ncbi:MAG: transcriptional regulator [Candidatus Competibacteraceae bacterium]|nr:MAG: transcriptional regulator [Candidatus Competibacteraceae bacterium]
MEPVLSIHDEARYETALARADALIDDGALNPSHPLHDFLDVLGTLIHAYEEKNCAMPPVGGAQILRFLLEQHDLGPDRLPEVGERHEVAAILRGERALNASQIVRLAARFQVPADVFMDPPTRA